VDFPAYAGPLDLLLKLIRRAEVDIYDIPIAAITEQYLSELEAMERRDLMVAGDFLLMAATLLEIKSAMMLPRPPSTDDGNDLSDPRAALVQHLLEYEAFQQVASALGDLERQQRLIYTRPFLPAALGEFGPIRPPVSNLNVEALTRSLQRMLDRLEADGDPITSLPREHLPLRIRIAEILADLSRAGARGAPLEALVHPHRGRLFMVVSFLALLELLRFGKIRVADEAASHRFHLTRPNPQNLLAS